MKRGYIRVSTKGQAKDGNSIEAQKAELRAQGVSDDQMYIDSFTGTKLSRPEFSRLCEDLLPGDTLIVTKLDRFARSLGKASELITELIDRGITIHVLNLGILSNDSVNTLMRNVLLAFAQFERDMIVQRTQEGKAIAREKPDFKEGRPQKYDKEKLDYAMELLKKDSYAKVSKVTGISVSTLSRYHRSMQSGAEA